VPPCPLVVVKNSRRTTTGYVVAPCPSIPPLLMKNPGNDDEQVVFVIPLLLPFSSRLVDKEQKKGNETACGIHAASLSMLMLRERATTKG
jgi:hypothetical protein